MHRKDILEAAIDLTCNDRQAVYGEPADNFSNIANLLTAYLQGKYDVALTLTAEDAALMLALVKIARTYPNVRHDDNYIDAAAYAALAGELA